MEERKIEPRTYDTRVNTLNNLSYKSLALDRIIINKFSNEVKCHFCFNFNAFSLWTICF